MATNKIIDIDTTIISAASAVGKKEIEGPLGSYFDIKDDSDKYGMDSFEKAEAASLVIFSFVPEKSTEPIEQNGG